MFATVKKTFHIDDEVVLNVKAVELDPGDLNDATQVAGTTLRKLQALYYVTTPGQATKIDILVALAAELDRALADLAVLVDDRSVQKELHRFANEVFVALEPLISPREPADPSAVITI